jgi:hypothetical protein
LFLSSTFPVANREFGTDGKAGKRGESIFFSAMMTRKLVTTIVETGSCCSDQQGHRDHRPSLTYAKSDKVWCHLHRDSNRQLQHSIISVMINTSGLLAFPQPTSAYFTTQLSILTSRTAQRWMDLGPYAGFGVTVSNRKVRPSLRCQEMGNDLLSTNCATTWRHDPVGHDAPRGEGNFQIIVLPRRGAD